MQKMPRKGYCMLASLGRNRVFWSYVARGFGLGRSFLGCDRGFPGHNRVVFILVFCCDKGPPMPRQCFILCRDNVAIEVPL